MGGRPRLIAILFTAAFPPSPATANGAGGAALIVYRDVFLRKMSKTGIQ